MEESFGCKGRHVLVLNPNAMAYAAFSRKYMSYLLHALLKATNGNRTTQIQKVVRFEVDMALVLSADESKWSHALKHELEASAEASKCYEIELDSRVRIPKKIVYFEKFQAIPRPIIIVKAPRARKDREEQDFDSRIRVLQRLLPGGRQMNMCDLISEVQIELRVLPEVAGECPQIFSGWAMKLRTLLFAMQF